MAKPKSGSEALSLIEKHDSDLGALKADFSNLSKALSEVQRVAVGRQVYEVPAESSIDELDIPANVRGDLEKTYQWTLEQPAKPGSSLDELQTLNDSVQSLGMCAGPKHVSSLRGLKTYKRWRKLYDHWRAKAAMDTTADSDWVPTQVLSSRLLDKVRDRGRLAPLFVQVPMTGPTFDIPVLGDDATPYLIAEQTVAPEDTGWQRITSSVPTTTKVSLGARKLATRVVLSNEFLEDQSVDSGWLQGQVAQVVADAIDEVILDGDTAGTHQDLDVTAAADRRKAWIGLRAHAFDQSYASSASGAITATDCATARGLMGKWGGYDSTTEPNTVLIISPKGYAQLMQDTTGITTVDKYGVGAPVVTGEVFRVFGMPVIVSQHVRENLAATGLYDGSTTDETTAILVNRGGFVLGTRRSITIRTSQDILMESDQTVSVCTWRGDFEPIHAIGSNHMVHVLYNVT